MEQQRTQRRGVGPSTEIFPRPTVEAALSLTFHWDLEVSSGKIPDGRERIGNRISE